MNEARWHARFLLVFAAYLFVHFASLLPYGTELFSSEGLLPRSDLSPLAPLFPSILSLWDSPAAVAALLSLALLCAALLAAGSRVAALLLWYIHTCLLIRNPMILNPAIPYIGWLLLACATVKRGRAPALRQAAWLLLAAGYSYSGLTKLVSPSWLDGSALLRVLESPLCRPGPLTEALRSLPGLSLLSYGALLLELCFLPLAFFKRLRPWLWGGMLAMHLSLIAVVDFADLSLGMVMIHLFVWPLFTARATIPAST